MTNRFSTTMDKRRLWCFASFFPAVLLLTAVTARAQSFVAPPESLPGGLSYQQWSAKWWQWEWSIPLPINPVGDTTGIDCAVYQSGPVWFLAGTSGFNATRSCTIPVGK